MVFKEWDNVRILGVLQRIAFCYLFASLLIYFFTPRTVIIISVVVLLTYWFLCYLLGEAGDPYSLHGYFGTSIDKVILGEGHMYKGDGLVFDPEGITSTLPAIIQIIAGYFIGKIIQAKGKSYEMLSTLFISGSVLIFLSYCWDMAFPINKKIWTSSYVLYSSGLAIFVLALLIYLIEFKQVKGLWTRFFDVFW